jgi:hypothetical protein
MNLASVKSPCSTGKSGLCDQLCIVKIKDAQPTEYQRLVLPCQRGDENGKI